jgi:hypothetical protein
MALRDPPGDLEARREQCPAPNSTTIPRAACAFMTLRPRNDDCRDNELGLQRVRPPLGTLRRLLAHRRHLPRGQFCDGATFRCAPGCRNDEGCAPGVTDGGVGRPRRRHRHALRRRRPPLRRLRHRRPLPRGPRLRGQRSACGLQRDAALPAGRSPAATARASTRRTTPPTAAPAGPRCAAANGAAACVHGRVRGGPLHGAFGDCDGERGQRLRDRHRRQRGPLRRLRAGLRRAPQRDRDLRRGRLRLRLRRGLRRLRHGPEPTAARSTPARAPPTAAPAATPARCRQRHGGLRDGGVRRGRLRRGLRRLRRRRHQRLRGRHAHHAHPLRRAAGQRARRPPTPRRPARRGRAGCAATTGFGDCDGREQRLRGRHPHQRRPLRRLRDGLPHAPQRAPVVRGGRAASVRAGFADCDGCAPTAAR